MKIRGNSRFAWFFLLTVLLITACKVNTKPTESASYYEPLALNVTYTEDGQEIKGKLLIVSFVDAENSTLHFSEWYLQSTTGRNIKVLDADYAPVGMYAAVVSNNSKYIAVGIAAEGHPWIEIINVDSLIQKSSYVIESTLNPYPGGINPESWSGDDLIVGSDINLERKTDSTNLNLEDILDSYKQFVYSLKKKKFTLKK